MFEEAYSWKNLEALSTSAFILFLHFFKFGCAFGKDFLQTTHTQFIVCICCAKTFHQF